MTHPGFGEQVDRCGGIQFDLLPKLTDQHAQVFWLLDRVRPPDPLTVVLPAFVPARWWHHLFHDQRALLIKGALLLKPNIVVTSVPFHLRR